MKGLAAILLVLALALALALPSRVALALLTATVSSTGNLVSAGEFAPPQEEAPPGGGGGAPPPPPPPAPAPAPPPEPTGALGPSTTGNVTAAGTRLGVNGGSSQPGGVSVIFPPHAVSASVDIAITASDAAPIGVAPPSGASLLPITIDITPATPLTLGQTVTLEVYPTAAMLAAAGGDLHNLGVGVITPSGVHILPVTVVDDTLVVLVDHFSQFAIFAVTKPGPTLQQPPSGAHARSLGPLLSWTNPAGTTWFQVQVAPFNSDGPGIDLVIGDTGLVHAAQYQVTAPNFGSATPNYVMLPGMTYFWRVRTAATRTTPTDADWSIWKSRAFMTAEASSATISLVSPEMHDRMASLTPTLTWANADQAVFYYEVQVSADPSFSSDVGAPPLYWELVHGGVSRPLNSYTIPSGQPLQRGATYYWRVRPRVQGDGVPMAWTQAWSFVTP